MLTGLRPDITPAQITAALGWVVAQAVAFGWLDGKHAQTLIGGGATIVAAAWSIADAYLRGARNKALAPAAPTTLGVTTPQTPQTFTATLTPTQTNQ